MKKRGQLKLSFGMIFSIILIIAFITFAFFAIKSFLGMQDKIKIEKFFDNLRTDTNKLWQSTRGKNIVEYYLPTSSKPAQKVCFFNQGERNVEVLFKNGLKDKRTINHLTTQDDFCAPVINGKVKFYLIKNYGEPRVYAKKI